MEFSCESLRFLSARKPSCPFVSKDYTVKKITKRLERYLLEEDIKRHILCFVEDDTPSDVVGRA